LVKKIKAAARKGLRGNFLMTAAIVLVILSVPVWFFLLEQALLSFFGVLAPEFDLVDSFTGSFYAGNTYLLITTLLLLLELTVLSLLAVGVKLWFFENQRYSSPSFSLIFYAFLPKNLLRVLRLRVLIFLRKLPVRFLALLPAAAVLSGAYFTTYYQSFYAAVSGSFLFCSGILLLAAGWGLSACYNLRFFPADYLSYIYPNISGGEVIRHSAYMAKKYRKGLFRLQCSFLPWGIVSILLFPLFRAVPYYLAAISVPAVQIIKEMPLYAGAAPKEVIF